jgi:molybdopterin adenylyltransferase
VTAELSGPRIGILTISDRASRGEYEDLGGPAILDCLQRAIAPPWQAIRRIVPDEQPVIEQSLIELADRDGCCLIVTTGGTGPAPRDVTPEATVSVCDRLMPGFAEAMRAKSLLTVPTAVLSRQTAGFRGKTLIVNLPGKPAAIAVCLEAVLAAIPYGIELAGGPRLRLLSAKMD